MIICKNCGKSNYVKNGFVRGKQRYRCRECGYNFTDTLQRGRSEATKALAILLYSMGKASYRFIGKLLDVSAVAVYKWIRKAALEIPAPELVGEIKEVELDELWHFLHSKKQMHLFHRQWTSYPEVIPAERHIIGKRETHGVERDNSNTRHRVGRFNRRTKVVSHSEQMIDLSMRILTYFENINHFADLQKKFLSILG